MFHTLCFFFLGLLLLNGSSSENDGKFRCSSDTPLNIGVIADNRSRVGREHVIAIQMALKDYDLFSSCDHKVELLLVDSPENSAQATATGKIDRPLPNQYQLGRK